MVNAIGMCELIINFKTPRSSLKNSAIASFFNTLLDLFKSDIINRASRTVVLDFGTRAVIGYSIGMQCMAACSKQPLVGKENI